MPATQALLIHTNALGVTISIFVWFCRILMWLLAELVVLAEPENF